MLWAIDSTWPAQAELQAALDKAYAEIERLGGKKASDTSLEESASKKLKTGNPPTPQTAEAPPEPAPSSRGGARKKVTWLEKLKDLLRAF